MSTEKTIGTLKEVAVLSGGAIAGAYFLDPNVFFANQIKANPSYAQNFYVVHWGGIVSVAAAYASTQMSNPYAKGALIGLSIYGALFELRTNFGWNNAVSPPSPNWGMMGPKNVDTAALDQKLKALADQSRLGGRGGAPAIGLRNGSPAIGRERITQTYKGSVGNRITRGYMSVGQR